jgi:chromosome segregation ATPase
MSYKKVVNRLNAMKAVNFNLVEDSDEDAILTALAKLENKISFLNEEMEDKAKEAKVKDSESMDRKARLEEMKSKAEDAETKLKESKSAYDKACMNVEQMEADNKILKEKVKNFEDSKSTSELAIKTERAKNLIKQHEMKFGYAENAEKREAIISSWEKRAVDNYEDTEMILEAMGMKVSVPRPALAGGTPPSLKTSIPVKNGDVMKFMQAEQMKKMASNREKITPANFAK